MKCLMLMHKTSYLVSPSMRREWIEINYQKYHLRHEKSPSMRREWIEMTKVRALYCQMVSPSMRREWIEILCRPHSR